MNKKTERLYKLILMAMFAALFIRSAVPTIAFGDGSDLILSAKSLGVAHPTGYPLYMLIARLWLYLPFGNDAFGLNLLSAAFAVWALSLLYKLMRELLPEEDLINILAASIAVIVFGLSRTFWAQAIKTEIFTMYICLVLLIMIFSIRFHRDGRPANYYKIAFTAGIGISHHLSVALLLPAAMIYILPVLIKLKPSKHFKAAALLVTGCSPWLYILHRSRVHPIRNWGNPHDLPSFFNYLTGGQYKGYLSYFPGHFFIPRFEWFLNTLNDEFGLVFAVLLLVALPATVFMTRRFGLLALAVLVLDLGYGLNVYIVSERSLLLPAYIVLSISMGIATAKILGHDYSRPAASMIAKALVVLLSIAGLASQIAANFQMANNGKDTQALEFAKTALAASGPGAILVMDGDNIFPVEYLHGQTGFNGDTVLLQYRMLTQEWYRQQARRNQDFVIPLGLSNDVVLLKIARQYADTQTIYFASPHALNGFNLVFDGVFFRAIPGHGKILLEPKRVYKAGTVNIPFTGDYFRWQANNISSLNLLTALLATGQSKDAVRLSRSLACDYPDNALAQMYLGAALESAGSLKAARTSYTKALDLDLNMGDAYFGLGRVFLSLKDESAARANLERALAYQPQNPQLLYMLAQVYENADEPFLAYAIWRRLLEIPGETPYDKEARARF